MEKKYLNIDKIPDIKTLWHAGWLFSDIKDAEIVLQVNKENYKENNPLMLQTLYIGIGDGILNSKTNGVERQNFESLFIDDYNHLVKALRELTNLKFSIEITE